jgi:hypothetical protein
MDLSPNLEFPSKEDPQITQTYLHAAYANGHKKLADHLVSYLYLLAQTGSEIGIARDCLY